MTVKHVKIGNWDVCCNNLVSAVVHEYVRLVCVDAVHEKIVITSSESSDDDPYFFYCPYCGTKLP